MSKEYKAYVYENTGKEQDIKGIGLVREGETITVPHKEIKHPDLKLVKTETHYEDEGEEEKLDEEK